LNPAKNETYEVIGKLVKEVSKWFPDECFHIGMDEVFTDCWNNLTDNESGQNKTRNDEKDRGKVLLQTFLSKVQDIIEENGKKTIMWHDTFLDKNLETKYKNTLFHVWREYAANKTNITKEFISKGYDVVCSYYDSVYLDRGVGPYTMTAEKYLERDSVFTWQKFYKYDILEGLTKEEEKHVLGGEAPMWTEMINDNNVEPTVFPRLSALGENLWTSTNKAYEEFITSNRLYYQNERMGKRGVRVGPVKPDYCGLHPYYC